MDSEERQKEILNIALKIIHERGYKALTVRNIAEKIDITEPAIYRHFNNKEEILMNLANKAFEKNKININHSEYENPYNLLKKLVLEKFKKLEKKPYFIAILFHSELFREYPKIQELFHKHRKRNEETIKDIVKKGKENGFFSKKVDEENFALIFMGTIRMTVLKWRSKDFSYSLKEKGTEIIEELFKILEKQNQEAKEVKK